MKKNSFSKVFLKRWLKIFEKNYELIDDSPSKIKNHIDFVENRHDQSIFSLISKKMGAEVLKNETNFQKRQDLQFNFHNK